MTAPVVVTKALSGSNRGVTGSLVWVDRSVAVHVESVGVVGHG